MAHLTDGTLRRMVDDPDARAGTGAAHLEGCDECKARFEAAASDARAIGTLLAVPDAHVDVARAFDRVRTAPAARPQFGFRLPLGRPGTRRPLVLAFATAVAALGLLATVIAQDQTTFAPATVQPVPVTLADMQALSQLADYGTVTWTKEPNVQVAVSAADAATAAGGMQPPVVKSLPAGVSSEVTYAAMPQAQAVFTFSAAKAAAAAASHGKTLPPLPAGMDGTQLTVTVGPAVGEIYGNLNASSSSSELNLPQLVVGKSAAPIATTSSKVTVDQMVDYILRLPGITPELKAAVSAIKNKSTTLPIPIPVQYATSKTVTVQGVAGVALGDNTGVGAGVIWEKNGIVYAVAGTIKQSDAIDIANNLR